MAAETLGVAAKLGTEDRLSGLIITQMTGMQLAVAVDGLFQLAQSIPYGSMSSEYLYSI